AAFIRAQEFGALLIQHCEFHAISAGGVMHLGDVSRRLGLSGLDPRSEEAMIERDIALCRETGARYHVAHISTAKAVELVRRAKSEGLPVTTEVCTHHLMLTDEACAQADPNTKMHPPLRPQADVAACRHGLLDGTIDCIVTDHAPHTAEEKSAGFLKAPAGIVGLETAVGIAAKAMIESDLADWPQLIGWLTAGPARVLRREGHTLEIGHAADLTLIDPNRRWTVDPDRFLSKSRNTPFGGWELTGRAVGTVRRRTTVLAIDA
ncbi:MAG: amidohydrolase family protein, partial [Phycisphaerales bacterium]|nr:amidohydrolase family protein [Phycisphaerales bacterium]